MRIYEIMQEVNHPEAGANKCPNGKHTAKMVGRHCYAAMSLQNLAPLSET